jgi:hypothetical protein
MSFLAPLRVPLQALIVALAGVGVAWLFLNGHVVYALLAVAAILALGAIVDAIGKSQLPKRPVRAVYLLQGWLLIPLGLAVLATAGTIVVAVELTLPEGTAAETEELVGALSTGIVTFLTAGFIAKAGDDKNSQLADHIKEAFESKYTRGGTSKDGTHAFVSGSKGEQWVYSDEFEGIEGWGRKARLKRAEGVAAELKSGNSNPSGA